MVALGDGRHRGQLVRDAQDFAGVGTLHCLTFAVPLWVGKARQ